MSSTSSLSAESLTSNTSQESPSPTDLLFYQHRSSVSDHFYRLLEYEIPTELPLRIMFSYNSGHKLPTVRDAHRWWNLKKGRMIIEFLSSLDRVPPLANDTTSSNPHIPAVTTPIYGSPESHHIRDANDRFMDSGNEFLLNINFAAELAAKEGITFQGLPSNFVSQFCLNVFTPEYRDADFDQALAAIDYLRDYECSRHQTLREAAKRLGVTKDNIGWVLKNHYQARDWVQEVEDAEVMIEEWYTTAYLGLRIWTMVSVLHAEPFYKPNVLAMLNTLFPPGFRSVSGGQSFMKEMHKCRETLYNFIVAIEKDGQQVVDILIDKLTRTPKHSWRDARDSLVSYFAMANNIITKAKDPKGPSYLVLRDSCSEGTRTTSVYTSTSERRNTGSSANTSVEDKSPTMTSWKQSTPVPQMFHSDGVWRMVHNTPGSRTAMKTTSELGQPKSGEAIQEPSRGVKFNRMFSRGLPMKGFKNRPSSRAGTPTFNVSCEAMPALRNLPLSLVNAGRQIAPMQSETPINGPGWEGKFVTDLGATRIPTPLLGSANVYTPGSTKTLPSDGYQFLNSPYENPESRAPKKKSSMTSLFSRTRKSSSTSLRENYKDGGGLGITLHSTKSTETLRSSVSHKQSLRPLKKVKSIASIFSKKQFSKSVESVVSLKEVYDPSDFCSKTYLKPEDAQSLTPPVTSHRFKSSKNVVGEPPQETPTLRSLLSVEDSKPLPLPRRFRGHPDLSYNLRHAASTPALRQARGIRLIPPKRLAERAPLQTSSPVHSCPSNCIFEFNDREDPDKEKATKGKTVKKKRSFWRRNKGD